MELDIDRGKVAFIAFSHDGNVVGHRLLPDMPVSGDRYPVPDWRDLFTVTPAS